MMKIRERLRIWRADKQLLSQFKRYLAIGFTTFAIEYTGFFLLYRVAALNYLLANVMVYCVSFWFNYLANRRWTFQSKLALQRQLPLYALLFAFNLFVANVGLLYLLTSIIGIPALVSKILVMGAIVSWNFILYRTVIYRQ